MWGVRRRRQHHCLSNSRGNVLWDAHTLTIEVRHQLAQRFVLHRPLPNSRHCEARPHSGWWVRRWKENDSWRVFSHRHQRRIVLTAGPRCAHFVAHSSSEMPDNRLISTACCTLHKYQRRGAIQLGSREHVPRQPRQKSPESGSDSTAPCLDRLWVIVANPTGPPAHSADIAWVDSPAAYAPTSPGAHVRWRWHSRSEACADPFVSFIVMKHTRRPSVRHPTKKLTAASVRGGGLEFREKVLFVLRIEMAGMGPDELDDFPIALGRLLLIASGLVYHAKSS